MPPTSPPDGWAGSLSSTGTSPSRAERNIRSPEQVKRLISFLRTQSPEPFLVAVDQEGGAVARLKEAAGFPPPAPSARDMAAGGDPAVTRAAAAEHGRDPG